MDDAGRSLEQIRDRLAEQANDPVATIDSLTPTSRIEVLNWACRLPLDPEFTDTYGPKVVGIARTIANRAKREHNLRLTEDGRIITKEHGVSRAMRDLKPTRVFMFPVAGESVTVEGTRSDS
jgi:hypothetical protein